MGYLGIIVGPKNSFRTNLELILGPMLGFILGSFSLSLGVVLGTLFENLSRPLLTPLWGSVWGQNGIQKWIHYGITHWRVDVTKMLQKTIQNQDFWGCVGQFWGPNRPQKIEKKWDRKSDLVNRVSKHILKQFWGPSWGQNWLREGSQKWNQKRSPFPPVFGGFWLRPRPVL